MKTTPDPLELLYPGSKTTLMQHLQTLVLRGNELWIGGVIAPEKLERLAQKMGERYPVTRDERGRTYDRSKGLAGAHLVVYPTLVQHKKMVAWWVLTSLGKGGLDDPASPDHHVMRRAKAAHQHIEFEDYVLLYAHKKDARTLTDAVTGKEKRVIKNCSTWTWKIRKEALSELRAGMAQEVKALRYGDDRAPPHAQFGLRGFLYYQRQRPLFSGVRTQVLELHREAKDLWGGVHRQWLAKYPGYLERYGEKAGQLRPLNEVMSAHLPKMGRFKVFSDPARTVRSLIG